MKYKNRSMVASVMVFVLTAAVLLVIPFGASAGSAPELMIPDNFCFKLEASVPNDEVREEDVIEIKLTVGSLFGGFPTDGITGFSGKMYFDQVVYEYAGSDISLSHCEEWEIFVTEGSDGYDFRLKTSEEGLPVTEADTFEVIFTFKINRLPEDFQNGERCYIWFDDISAVCKNDRSFYGIGAISYCDIFFNPGISESSNLSDQDGSGEESGPEDSGTELLDFNINDILAYDYLYEAGDIIYGLKEKTPLLSFLNTHGEYDIKFYDINGNRRMSGYISNGYTMTITIKDITRHYNILLRGDINCDALISAIDYINLRYQIIGIIDLDGPRLAACDVNDDGKVGYLDYIKLRYHILGLSDMFD